MSTRRNGLYLRLRWLTLAVLVSLLAACQSDAGASERFVPPYLRLRLCAGAARLDSEGSSSDWRLEEEIGVDGERRIVADAEQGARICLGDGSVLDLEPGSAVKLVEARIFPHLQVTVRDGEVRFESKRPSYEFLFADWTARLLRVPARLSVASEGGLARLAVVEGAVSCTSSERTVTVLAGQEFRAEPGTEAFLVDIRDASVSSPVSVYIFVTPDVAWLKMMPTPILVPTITHTPTTTPTATATSTATPAPTREPSTPTPTVTPTFTPLPPTDTPEPPSSGSGSDSGSDSRKKREPTRAPTQAPTQPPTQAPTRPPTQAPTDPPPTPRPTQVPTRPAPTQQPTQAPTQPPPTSAPTDAPTQEPPTQEPPTQEPPTQEPPTSAPPEPTAEPTQGAS